MTLGFIGSGKMATALVEGVLRAGLCAPSDIHASDALPAASAALAEKCGVTIAPDNRALAAAAQILILCVKPTDASAALGEMETRGKLVISIVAGLPLAALAGAAPGARIIRVMPNTPALIGRGAAAYALGPTATPEDEAAAQRILGAVGAAFPVSEKLLNAVTGLSGSGPAYVYVIIEALADAGVLEGLPRELALELAARTVAGGAAMVLETGLHPGQLRDMVASPGGTTIAGLAALERAGLRAALIDAVHAATARSRELGESR